MKETIFDCNSGGVPHKHCMDTMIAEKGDKETKNECTESGTNPKGQGKRNL